MLKRVPYAADAFVRAEEGVLQGQRYCCDVVVGGGAFAGLACEDVVVVAVGVGPDAGDLMFAFQVLVGYARRNDEDVTSVDMDLAALFTPQHQCCGTFDESERFVGDGVIVMIGENAAIPRIGPAVLMEEMPDVASLEDGWKLEYVAIQDNRQCIGREFGRGWDIDTLWQSHIRGTDNFMPRVKQGHKKAPFYRGCTSQLP